MQEERVRSHQQAQNGKAHSSWWRAINAEHQTSQSHHRCTHQIAVRNPSMRPMPNGRRINLDDQTKIATLDACYASVLTKAR